MWILLWRRAPTRAGTSLVKDGLLGPRLLVGACAPMTGEAWLPDTPAAPTVPRSGPLVPFL